MNRLVSADKSFVGPVIVVGVIVTVWLFRDRLFIGNANPETAQGIKPKESTEKQTVLEISAQARKNLSLVAKPAKTQTYWRTVLIPGEIADRPGVSDRGVTSPAVGIVTAIHAFPGDTMRPGDSLFTVRLFSEYLQSTQTQLFKATQEALLAKAQVDRVTEAAGSGAVSQVRLIELQNEVSRQNTLVQASRQDLLTRGLSPDQVRQVEGGTFVSTIDVATPPLIQLDASASQVDQDMVRPVSFETSAEPNGKDLAYEVQELSVELGQQVQAGQLLAKLSNHQSLQIVGHAFKREASFLEQAAQEGRPIEIEFAEEDNQRWPELNQTFEIRHLSNTIDADSRTFGFYIPMTNQSRSYEKSGRKFLVWRFRPGQRVRIHVPVEQYDDVFVLPSEAVVHEGPETYVFRQNGDLFKRFSVHVLHEDRRSCLIANDGSIPPGSFLAQSSAASLNRVLKAQTASGEQPGLHVHPDGTSHAAH